MPTAGLYPNNDVDLRKLKKLIQTQKLAPFFPGADSDTHEVSSWLACVRRRSFQRLRTFLACMQLEECPICFLFYPALNRAQCCSKSICTECFLQVSHCHC